MLRLLLLCGNFCYFYFLQDLIRFSSNSEIKRHIRIPVAATLSRWHICVWHSSLHAVSGSAGPSGGRTDVVVFACRLLLFCLEHVFTYTSLGQHILYMTLRCDTTSSAVRGSLRMSEMCWVDIACSCREKHSSACYITTLMRPTAVAVDITSYTR